MKTNKFEKAGELMWLLGLVFVSLGVAICSKANLGVSMIAAPTFVIHEALENISSFFSLGVTEYLFMRLFVFRKEIDTAPVKEKKHKNNEQE